MTALQGGTEKGRETEKKKEERLSHILFGCDYYEDVEDGIWSSTLITNVEFSIVNDST